MFVQNKSRERSLAAFNSVFYNMTIPTNKSEFDLILPAKLTLVFSFFFKLQLQIFLRGGRRVKKKGLFNNILGFLTVWVRSHHRLKKALGRWFCVSELKLSLINKW